MIDKLHFVLLSLSWFTSSVSGLYKPPGTGTCKTYPGSSDWPSANTWAKLNQTLGGRLLHPAPPGAVCHPDQPTYDPKQCPVIAKDWKTYEWHAGNPVSVMWDQWANSTCLPNNATPCSNAGYPAFVVNATCAEHVKAGVDFARKYNVRLNVKNTGHDYLGRSNAPGSLSIWTRNLKGIQYHAGQYRLGGCGKVVKTNAVTFGGGSEMYDLYVATDKYNQTVVGGGAKTVGAGGYTTGGGHSILAPRYGLAADNVLEMEIVTPGGDIVVANEGHNQDLFWAMRGGGGSTFGIITSMTIKTHPTPKIVSAQWIVITDPKESFVFDLIAYILSQIPRMMDQGVSGYNLITKGMANPIPIPGFPDHIAGVLGTIIMQDVQGPDAFEEVFKPINDTVRQRWGGKIQFFAQLEEFDSFLGWFNKNFDGGSAGDNSYLVSRLLDEKTLTGDPKKLGIALQSAMKTTGSMSAFMVAGKGVQKANPSGGSNAVNPAWRTAYVHALTAQGFESFNITAQKNVIKDLNEDFQPLRDLTPRSGAYINEAMPYEKDWQKTFWGDNYNRLLKIKRSIDPHDTLWCFPCVGYERWEVQQDGKLCRKHGSNDL